MPDALISRLTAAQVRPLAFAAVSGRATPIRAAHLCSNPSANVGTIAQGWPRTTGNSARNELSKGAACEVSQPVPPCPVSEGAFSGGEGGVSMFSSGSSMSMGMTEPNRSTGLMTAVKCVSTSFLNRRSHQARSC